MNETVSTLKFNGTKKSKRKQIKKIQFCLLLTAYLLPAYCLLLTASVFPITGTAILSLRRLLNIFLMNQWSCSKADVKLLSLALYAMTFFQEASLSERCT